MLEFNFKIDGEHDLSNNERRKFANALHRALLCKNWSSFEVYKSFFVCEGVATAKGIAKIEDVCAKYDVDFTFEYAIIGGKSANDSLIRAMETNLKNAQAALAKKDYETLDQELHLYQICNNALLRKGVA